MFIERKEMEYTFTEKTVKKYSQADIESHALILIKDKGKEISSRYLSDAPSKTPSFTLVELNAGVESIFQKAHWPPL